MRREISEAKPMEAKTHIGLDDVVKRSFERLQKGVIEKAEEKLDAATEKSFAELEKSWNTKITMMECRTVWSRIFCRMQSIKETDMSTLPITLEGCLQPKETCI